MAKVNYGKALSDAALVGAAVVGVDIAGDMLVERVSYLQKNPELANGGMLVAGAIVASMGKGKNKQYTDALGIALVVKGSLGLSNQYVKPMLPGTTASVTGSPSMYLVKGTNLDRTTVAGSGLDQTMVAGTEAGYGFAG